MHLGHRNYYPPEQDVSKHYKTRTFFPCFSMENNIDYIPMHLSEIAGYIRETPSFDVAFLHLSLPDEKGYCSWGNYLGFQRTVVECAKIVVAEVNSKMPFVFSDDNIHVSEIDYFIESNSPLSEIDSLCYGDVEKQIGENVAELIPDSATIQFGMGQIIDAILFSLEDKRDIGVHSGLLSDAFVNLCKKGIITNNKKEIDRHKTIATMLVGTDKIYQYCHLNKFVELRSTQYTHNIDIIKNISNFVSINSAIEVDLTGQVNAEYINGKQIGGTGGQLDFIRGAFRSPGGKAIIALPSTSNNNKISRIVPRLNDTVVTTPRADIQYVVTEYGFVNLVGKSLRERIEKLIEIAHPKFREELGRSLLKGQ
jgi:4-hydroxybutyrate CoA-transferase